MSLIVTVQDDGTGVGTYNFEVFVNVKSIARGRVVKHASADDWRILLMKVINSKEVNE